MKARFRLALAAAAMAGGSGAADALTAEQSSVAASVAILRLIPGEFRSPAPSAIVPG